MSDTPITDAAKWHTRTPGDPLGIEVVADSCASDLERQLAEAIEQRDALADFARNVATTSSSSRLRREAKAALAAVKGGTHE